LPKWKSTPPIRGLLRTERLSLPGAAHQFAYALFDQPLISFPSIGKRSGCLEQSMVLRRPQILRGSTHESSHDSRGEVEWMACLTS